MMSLFPHNAITGERLTESEIRDGEPAYLDAQHLDRSREYTDSMHVLSRAHHVGEGAKPSTCASEPWYMLRVRDARGHFVGVRWVPCEWRHVDDEN
jgi:hypothetical protein